MKTKTATALSALLVMALVLTSSSATAFEVSNERFTRQAYADVDLEELRFNTPKTYADAASQIKERHSFIIWEPSGRSFLSGYYGNGNFVGNYYTLIDGKFVDTGKQMWGVYSNGLFYGFFDGNGPENFVHGQYKYPGSGPYFIWYLNNLGGKFAYGYGVSFN
jgi:hypothetical protein